MPATPFRLDGQRGWAHDDGHPAGTFHTFDALDVSPVFSRRKVHVMLPRSYAAGRDRYPVVYLHDGDTAFWPGGVAHRTWDVAGVLSELGERVRELIVVAVHPVDRDAEYTHVDWYHGERPWGRLPDHAHYVADAIVGFVDRHYRTVRDPELRAVVGSSHGGLAAFYTATRRPDVFGHAACLSPSFFSGLDSLRWGPRPVPLAEAPLVREVRGLLADRRRRPSLWMCWGLRRDGGEHDAIVERLATLRGREMAELLVRDFGYRRQDFGPDDTPRRDADLFVHEDRVGGHDEAAWRFRFGLAMQAFFPGGRAY